MALCVSALLSILMANAETVDSNSTPEELYKAGSAAFQSGNFAEATKCFELVLAASPKEEALDTILFALGSAYFNKKDFTKAEGYFNRSLKEFPQGKNALKDLIAIAKIQSQTGRKEEAQKTLQKASEAKGDLAATARLGRATILAEAGKSSEVVTVLRPLIEGGIKDDLSAQAAMMITENETKQGHFDEALALLKQLQGVPDKIDNLLLLDVLAVQIGDGFLSKQKFHEALRMYSIVRSKQTVFELQKQRIAGIEKNIVDNKASLQRNPTALIEINANNTRLEERLKPLKDGLIQFEKQPDMEIPVRIRQIAAYDGLEQKWETILIWETILETCKDPKIIEDAYFNIAAAYCSLLRPDDAPLALDRYLAKYPNGKFATEVGYLKGALALEGNDYVKAETVFGTLIKKDSTSALASNIQFLLANSAFAQGDKQSDKYKIAITEYKNYLSKFSTGKFAEESSYRIPLAYFQLGDYGPALEGFEAYAKKYPSGIFIGDCGYRIALCYKAAEKHDEVLSRCAEWLKKHQGEVMYAEVLALQGDAYAAKEMPDESADSYRRAVTMGSSNEVLRYALFEANKQYQKKERWSDIAAMFADFVELHPDHPISITAVYWVSKAKIKMGKMSEAREYLAQCILKNIGDRSKDTVEKLLTQLAQSCAKRPRIPLIRHVDADAVAQTSSTDTQGIAASQEATPPPRPTPTQLPPYDAEAEFSKYLNEEKVGSSPLARARLIYAKAELAGFTKNPDRQKELLTSIYTQFPANQLSALLLAECGDIALDQGKVDKAEAFYKEFIDSFPTSELLEYAYYGLGEVALSRKKPEEAIYWFDEAVDKAAAEAKIADITYGKGQALLMQNKFFEAKKVFEQIIATKDWRGELTAKAVLSLGDLEEKRGETSAAIQYYQRVFVAYQRYPEVNAQAYIKAADGFIKLGDPAKAAAHLREMLSKPRLAATSLAEEAREKLKTLPAAPEIKPGPTPSTAPKAPSQS